MTIEVQMAIAVITTGNHYLLDALAGVGLTIGALAVIIRHRSAARVASSTPFVVACEMGRR